MTSHGAKTWRLQQGDQTDLLWCKNVTSPIGGSNWPPMVQNVTSPTGGSNWPFRCLDCRPEVRPYQLQIIESSLSERMGWGRMGNSWQLSYMMCPQRREEEEKGIDTEADNFVGNTFTVGELACVRGELKGFPRGAKVSREVSTTTIQDGQSRISKILFKNI